MPPIDTVWERIKRYAGADFKTVTGLPFTYKVPGESLRVTREGTEINRSLSRTNFKRALAAMPALSPASLMGRQGPSYTWAILMDSRIRQNDW